MLQGIHFIQLGEYVRRDELAGKTQTLPQALEAHRRYPGGQQLKYF